MTEINHEYYVSLEVVKLLKQLGFDWECEYAYMPNTEMGNVPFKHLHNRTNYNELQYEVYSAPTLDVAQRWLREVKRKHIEASPENDEYTEWLFCIYNSDSIAYTGYKTYEEAIEAGIKKALKTILEKGE